MNNLVPAAPRSFADLELVPLQREVPATTPFESLWAAAYRQRYVLLAAFLVPVFIAALLSLTLTKRYTATASVQLDQQVPQVIPNGNLDPQVEIQDAPRFLQTQLDRVRSWNLAQAVEANLKLEKSPQALHALGIDPDHPGAIASLKKAIGLGSDEPFDTKGAVVAALQANVGAEAGLNTRLAQISFSSADPNVSARIANGFAEALVDTNISAKVENSDHAKQYLLGQLSQAKQRLESSEKTMLAYARAEDLTTTVVPTRGNDTDASNGSLRDQQLGTLTDSLSQATARRIDAQQSWSQVQNTSPMLLPDVQDNNAIQDLVAQRAQLQAALEEERQRHTENYPSVKEAEAKIHELDGQISSFASSIKSAYYGRYLAAAQQEHQLSATVAQMKGAAMSERERSVGYNALSRDVETNKAFYDGLLQRYKEVAAASGAPAANVSIVDRAWPPVDADSPSLARNLALGGMTGLILALFVGAVRERMHHVVRSPDDLERALNLPSLGVVPRITGPEEMDTALEDPASAQAEAYHSIAAALEGENPGELPKTLLITSSTAAEGKSTSALGIARSLSAMGKRVLLVDGDLRRPSATKLAGQSDKPGLSDVLEGSATALNSVDRDCDQGFSIVRAGDANAAPVRLLAASRIRKVFDQLAAKHDIVIIDGPPVMGLADAVLLARSVEAVLFIVEANRTHLSELELAISRLPQTNVIGGVITKFDPKTAGVRYGDYNYYTYQHQE